MKNDTLSYVYSAPRLFYSIAFHLFTTYYNDSNTYPSLNPYHQSAAICDTASHVHYSTRPMEGGVIEFMGQPALKSYHPTIYTSTNPPGIVLIPYRLIITIVWFDLIRRF